MDFDRDVRPILSDKCFPCHGPDETTRQADLRLDTREGGRADRGGYAAIVPGDASASEVLQRIESEDDALRMPPADSKLVLTAGDRAVLKRWIEQGARWSAHWAFVPPVMQKPPADDSGWSRNPIDQFVLPRIRESGLTPSPEASREALIRRVTMDLTGLPPTLEEIDLFLRDESANAYERVVDRLLRSPAYGERMAWEWLEAARYADTDGFQGDPTRSMWPWRDWLVAALNDNVPFDRLTVELLAGDLLPERTEGQILATGFNRNHMFNGEGGRIAEETRVENVFDRAETTATIWLGLTMTCCRCHDHKFDPVSQREYYEFFAFFNNTSESGARGGGRAPPVLDCLSPETRAALAQLDDEVRELQRQLAAPEPQWDAAQATWEAAQAGRLRELAASADPASLGSWHVLGPLPPPDGNSGLLFEHAFGPENNLDLAARYGTAEVAWKAADGLRDGEVFDLPETVGATYFYREIEAPSERTMVVSLGSDDGIRLWLNGEEVLARNVARAAAADQERAELKLASGSNRLLIKITNTGGRGGIYFRRQSETIGDFPPQVVEALLMAREQRTDQHRGELRDYYRQQHVPAWKKEQERLSQLRERRGELAGSSVPVMVMDELPEGQQRTTRILARGGYDKPGEVVTADTPDLLPPLPEGVRRDRLALARWLVDPANPLTARVTVNRHWQTFFGRGIVGSTEDFGSQGQRPTHPELLDYLAVWFQQAGWNTKALHKLIVMSATYRQSSDVTPRMIELDPENLWLARAPRYRWPSWMLRDQALAAGGLLVRQLGGPPVRPYQPDGIWAEATFGKIRYQPDAGDKLYRRSLYVFWRRIVGPTMFFDSGKRQTCEVKPTRTNTPLHALTTLNETAFVESARGLAERAMLEGGPAEEARIAWAFRAATAREADATERQILVDRWRSLRGKYAQEPAKARELLEVGDSRPNPELDVADLAALTVVCSLLLNLDETLSRE